MVGGLSTLVGLVCLGYALTAWSLDGGGAFTWDGGGWMSLSGPTCALVAAPLFLAVSLWFRPGRKSAIPTPDAEEERERLLRHAMRVETVGDLASMVAHQLRNHLQVMMGHAALASTDSAPDRDHRLATIRDEISSSIELLEQLLQLAHPDDGAAVRLDLVAHCREFGSSVRHILPSALDFQLELPERPVHVVLDPQGLEHSLLNLLINARHATSGHGRLTLRVAVEGSLARVEVTDTGSGIPEEALAHVFDPYFTTKPKGEGTGLGLAAVKRFVQSASGVVSVQSEVGRGTAFRLEFPLAGSEPAPGDPGSWI